MGPKCTCAWTSDYLTKLVQHNVVKFLLFFFKLKMSPIWNNLVVDDNSVTLRCHTFLGDVFRNSRVNPPAPLPSSQTVSFVPALYVLTL